MTTVNYTATIYGKPVEFVLTELPTIVDRYSLQDSDTFRRCKVQFRGQTIGRVWYVESSLGGETSTYFEGCDNKERTVRDMRNIVRAASLDEALRDILNTLDFTILSTEN